MTFDGTKPANNQSPALAPGQIRTNWSRLEALIVGDHVFNDTSAPDDGYHKVAHWVNQGATHPTQKNGIGLTYTANSTVTRNGVDQTAPHLFHKTYDGTTIITSPLSQAPIRAFVNFDGTSNASAGSSQTIRSSFNIDSVTRIGSGEGKYQINFTAAAIPTDTYAVCLTGQRSGVGNSAIIMSVLDVAYGTAVTTAVLQIMCVSDSGSQNFRNVFMGNVTIIGG